MKIETRKKSYLDLTVPTNEILPFSFFTLRLDRLHFAIIPSPFRNHFLHIILIQFAQGHEDAFFSPLGLNLVFS